MVTAAGRVEKLGEAEQDPPGERRVTRDFAKWTEIQIRFGVWELRFMGLKELRGPESVKV